MAERDKSALLCAECGESLDWCGFLAAQRLACTSCGLLTYGAVFPAILRHTEKGRPGDQLLVDSDASCFYHLDKKAVLACEACGRFLCALCDIELNERHLCAQCIESGKKKDKIKNIHNHRILYDELALALAVYPLLIFYLTILTAPAAIYVAIRYWRAPGSIIPRGKWRFIFAILFGVLQVAGWIVLAAFLVSKSGVT